MKDSKLWIFLAYERHKILPRKNGEGKKSRLFDLDSVGVRSGHCIEIAERILYGTIFRKMVRSLFLYLEFLHGGGRFRTLFPKPTLGRIEKKSLIPNL